MVNNSPKGNFKVDGIVEEALPGAFFRVKTAVGGEILAHLSGKMRMHYIKILPGDRVIIEMTLYDDKRGRIVRRL
ncbi:MAG: translation initiation factor IF-1 [Candidatus Harrisonbacteria bacterium]|nr:translation initiation factor IF-1 [Candidatus Harrisonbacteria bacterium]